MRGMTEVELDARKTASKKIRYRLEAAFLESGHSETLVSAVRTGIQNTIRGMEQQIEEIGREEFGQPFVQLMEPWLDLFRGIRVTSEGKRGVLTGELDMKEFLESLIGGIVEAVQVRDEIDAQFEDVQDIIDMELEELLEVE